MSTCFVFHLTNRLNIVFISLVVNAYQEAMFNLAESFNQNLGNWPSKALNSYKFCDGGASCDGTPPPPTQSPTKSPTKSNHSSTHSPNVGVFLAATLCLFYYAAL